MLRQTSYSRVPGAEVGITEYSFSDTACSMSISPRRRELAATLLSFSGCEQSEIRAIA